MINTTKNLIILYDNESIKKLIIKAAELTHQVILNHEGVESVTLEEAIHENARQRVRFSFYQYFSDIEKNQYLSKTWLNDLFHLVANRTSEEQLARIPDFFTDDAKALPRQKAKLQKCLQHLHLFFHNVWSLKIALLPTSYTKLPIERLKHPTAVTSAGKPIYINEPIGEDYYPEFLKLARSVVMKRPYNLKLNDHIPESAYDNINWYVHRVVRAQDVWELNDLTEKHLKEYSSLKGHEDLGFRKSNLWLNAIIEAYQGQLGFNCDLLNSTRGGGASNSPKTWLTKKESEVNTYHDTWEAIFVSYSKELISIGHSQGNKITSKLRRILLAPLLERNVPFPAPSDYKRDHLAIIKKSLQIRAPKTVSSYMIELNTFFNWLEASSAGFKNPIIKQIDIPKSKRPQGTTKELLPDGSYAVVLSYNYAVCEFIEYVNYHMSDYLRDQLIRTMNRKTILQTEEWGFIPFYLYKNKMVFIKNIPSTLLSPIRASELIKNRGGLKNSALFPHNSHITAIQMETGIRRVHITWLDTDTFNSVSLKPHSLYPRSYGVNKIHVNTDKSHGPWDATVSDAVLAILESQLKFKRHYLRGKDKPRWYNHVQNSPFGKISPLFATLEPDLGYADSFTIPSDTSLSRYWKVLIKTVSFEMLQNKDTQSLSAVENPQNLNLLEFVNDKHIKLKQTPHSCRSQVVTDKITILPPSFIKELTGHYNDEHLVYYAQVKAQSVDDWQKSSSDKFLNEVEAAVINTQTNNSPLKNALRGENLGDVLVNFGATSFDEMSRSNSLKGGIQRLSELNKFKSFKKHGISSELYFDTTHICPFDTQCPNDIIERFRGRKACGTCPYSIKTVDHLPAITAKLRKYTDEVEALQEIIDEAKKNQESKSSLREEVEIKKFYVDEIAAWTATHSFLAKMANELSKKDKWLVDKPDVVRKRLSQCKASNELSLILLKINDAEQSAKYMTPMLKAKISKLRKQLLISTKEYDKLLSEPENYDLLHEFKGLICSICSIRKIPLSQLSKELNTPQQVATLGLEEIKVTK